MVIPCSARKPLALGLGAMGIVLVATVALSPGVQGWLREEWHLRDLRSGNLETQAEAAWALLEMRSERGLVRLLKEPQAELLFRGRYFYYSNYPLPDICAFIQEIGPRNLDRICRDAFERGHLAATDIVEFCNRAVPGWVEAAKAMGTAHSPAELRSLDDLPQFIDGVGRFMDEVYGRGEKEEPGSGPPGVPFP